MPTLTRAFFCLSVAFFVQSHDLDGSQEVLRWRSQRELARFIGGQKVLAIFDQAFQIGSGEPLGNFQEWRHIDNADCRREAIEETAKDCCAGGCIRKPHFQP